MNPTLTGGVLGGIVALGLITLWLALTSLSGVRDRVEPFLANPDGGRDSQPSRSWRGASWVIGEGSRAWWFQPFDLARKHAVRFLDLTFGAESARRRLVQLGLDPDVEQFRMQQLRWAVLAMAGVAGLGCLRVMVGNPIAPVPWLILTLGAAVLAASLADYRLGRDARRQARRIAEELPAIAELMAFSVAAGLAPASALVRVANRTTGPLAGELRHCAAEVGAGGRFADSLQDAAARMNVASVTQFVDALVVAIERGTPVAEVLRAQAMDARAAGHRALMEQAGKREIFAMVPVVFLILPLVVVIAIYPGVHGLMIAAP